MSIAIRVNGRRRSSPPTPTYPVKGDIIGIDMNGDGTDEEYLVLKTVSGSVVGVLARASVGDSVFAASGNTYENGTLDIALNATYYATLSEIAKSAITDKTFRQDSWYRSGDGNPVYNGSYSGGTAYQVSLDNASFGNEITRHVYAISVQDIIDYLEVTTDMTSANSTLNTANVQEMFNTTSSNIWLCSARGGNSSNVMYIAGNVGRVNSVATGNFAAYPAFQIDLDKITWTPVYNMTISGNGDSSYCYVVNTDAETPRQYYTNGNTFSMSAGETLHCYVSGPLKRVTVNGVSQTLTDNAFDYIVNSNCMIALSFTINDHSYIDITTT